MAHSAKLILIPTTGVRFFEKFKALLPYSEALIERAAILNKGFKEKP